MEITQYVFVVLSIVFVRVGDKVWAPPGITIGNPFGRIGLAAVTAREAMKMDSDWQNVNA